MTAVMPRGREDMKLGRSRLRQFLEKERTETSLKEVNNTHQTGDLNT